MTVKKILVAAVGTAGAQEDIVGNRTGFRRTIVSGLAEGLKHLKHIPPDDFDIDYVEGQPGDGLARLVQPAIENRNPSLLFPIGNSARIAIRAATQLQPVDPPIPIVFAAISDPVDDDAIDSVAHPGRHTTGVSTSLRQTAHKCLRKFLESLELKERGGTVLTLHQPFFPPVVRALPHLREVAKTFHMDFEAMVLVNRDRLPDILKALPTVGKTPRVLLITPDDLVASEADRLIEVAHGNGIPVFAPQLEFVRPERRNPALGAFGIPGDRVGREAAELVHRILWEANDPGDLPVRELDDERKYFRFWWNNTVARQHGWPLLTAHPEGPDLVFPSQNP